ncbi:hypothetical protein BC938DRAFT_483121 [Jimgerdemannia flammicorona]|uniref:Uncharacterized protein n=1 Tax=Jimgerdemannia flammicorona TaxID=994334 RepID=A0A433QCN7_9FUNG|nr:hypothetical protein BC938DRAFT_483121 [Jimgerdemannia flammicorona]
MYHFTSAEGTTAIRKLLSDVTPEFKESVSDILNFKPISLTFCDDIGYETLNTRDHRKLLTLLYYAGYLTIRDGVFAIPNFEIYMQWVDWVVPALGNLFEYQTLLSMLISGNIVAFKAEFEKINMECLSFYNVGGSKPGKRAEIFYHAL